MDLKSNILFKDFTINIMNNKPLLNYIKEAKKIVFDEFQEKRIGYTESPDSFWEGKNYEILVVEVAKMLQKESNKLK